MIRKSDIMYEIKSLKNTINLLNRKIDQISANIVGDNSECGNGDNQIHGENHDIEAVITLHGFKKQNYNDLQAIKTLLEQKIDEQKPISFNGEDINISVKIDDSKAIKNEQLPKIVNSNGKPFSVVFNDITGEKTFEVKIYDLISVRNRLNFETGLATYSIEFQLPNIVGDLEEESVWIDFKTYNFINQYIFKQ